MLFNCFYVKLFMISKLTFIIKKIIIICLFLLLIFIIIAKSSYSVEITEVHYNPLGNDNNKEFVELYFEKNFFNDSNITNINLSDFNLSDYIFSDSSSSDKLELVKYVNNSNFALIVESGFNFSSLNCSIYSVGSTIGNGLNNDYDNVYLFDNNNNLEANLSYNNSTLNPNYETSYQKIKVNNYTIINSTHNLLNDSFYTYLYTNISPCFIAEINEFNYFSNIENENHKNHIINNSSKMNNNSNISYYCDFKLNIIPQIKKDFYQEESFIFKHEILVLDISNKLSELNQSNKIYNFSYCSQIKNNFSIQYNITDLYGNIKKTTYETDNLNYKSYTSKEKDVNVYIVNSKLVINDFLNEFNKSNNYVNYIFIHKSLKTSNQDEAESCTCNYEQKCESYFDSDDCNYEYICPIYSPPCMTDSYEKSYLTNITINSISFDKSNNNINVILNISKGDTNKKAIYVYVKNGRFYVTNKTTIYINEKYINKIIDVSLKIKDDYSFDFIEDNIELLTIYSEGLDKSISRNLTYFFEKDKKYFNNSIKPVDNFLMNNSSFPIVMYNKNDNNKSLDDDLYFNGPDSNLFNLSKNYISGNYIIYTSKEKRLVDILPLVFFLFIILVVIFKKLFKNY
jgi:hypothetical protein